MARKSVVGFRVWTDGRFSVIQKGKTHRAASHYMFMAAKTGIDPIQNGLPNPFEIIQVLHMDIKCLKKFSIYKVCY